VSNRSALSTKPANNLSVGLVQCCRSRNGGTTNKCVYVSPCQICRVQPVVCGGFRENSWRQSWIPTSLCITIYIALFRVERTASSHVTGSERSGMTPANTLAPAVGRSDVHRRTVYCCSGCCPTSALLPLVAAENKERRRRRRTQQTRVKYSC